MFQPSRPTGVQSGSARRTTEQGGINPLELLFGVGMGIGTGNWGPLIGSTLGDTAGAIYGGATTGDWSGLGGTFDNDNQPNAAGTQQQSGAQGGSASGGGGVSDTTSTDPNDPNKLASERMTPGVGQPMNQMAPQNQVAPMGGQAGQMVAQTQQQYFQDPLNWW